MNRHRQPPISEAELWQDTCPLRLKVRDVAKCASLPVSTVLYDLKHGSLNGWKRDPSRRNSPWFIARSDARAYVARMTGHHAA